MKQVPKLASFYAKYNIPNTIVKTANTIDDIIINLFCFPSFVLPLFFSQKLFVEDPVIVCDNPESSFVCINANIITVSAIIKYITVNIVLIISIYNSSLWLSFYYLSILSYKFIKCNRQLFYIIIIFNLIFLFKYQKNHK